MLDPRMKKLADVLVGYSTKIKTGDRVLIDAFEIPDEMVAVLIERVVESRGLPFVSVKRNRIQRALMRLATDEQAEILGRHDLDFMKEMQAYIALRGAANINEMSDVPDGECFTAPVRDSVNGVIHFNAGTIYNGKSFDDVRLIFKDGRIIEATGSDSRAINEILDTDEGARYAASSHWVSTRISSGQCAIFSSMRRSAAPSTSPPARHITRPTTAISRKSTGI